ncbi:AAA family ATPase [Streptomyces sp. NPDC096538]|uniref:McrB family protein n=1 Tax=Streptomyces sp. NPDC096538 TaxID=3155427 RepID=UPI00331B790A
MTDEQDQVTVTFENRDYALTQSPGEVILPQYGRKIHHDSACGHLTDSHLLSRLPDPERLLWRRLIDSAPSHDLDARAEFARSVGLLGGKGQPLTSVCSCVLRPISPRQAATMRPWPLHEALAAFDRNGRAGELDAMQAAARQVNEEFPWEDWPALPLERYALGQGDSARARPYCYLLEFGTKALGTIAGGSSAKHLIYRRSRDGSWWHDTRYTDEQEAWREVRAGIIAAVTAAREGRIADIDTIDAIRSGPSLVAKTLRIYAPDVSLPVYGNDVVRHFLQQLTGEPAPRLERFAMLARLKEVVDADERFRDWPYDLVVLFLYWWSDPFRTRQIVKIAPGGDGSVWGDCRAGGYVAIGWDDVADLRSYADKDEFQAAFSSAYAEKYHSNRSRITSKADELWKLLSLRPGDLVVANRGTSDILGVGRIAGDGYEWREDRAEFRHTVQVEWDESHAGRLEEPERSWATVTVKDVPASLWNRIRRAKSAPSALEDDPVPDAAETAPAQPLDSALSTLVDALDRRGQAVLYGPPGTGKTYTALRFAVRWLGELSADLPDVDPYAEPGTEPFRRTLDRLTASGRLTTVTFHPSYGYEDFVEGFRPVKDGPDRGGLVLDLVDGVFKQVCQRAAADPGHPYLVIVDELNRGNLPKIFGELITLLEKDKRGHTVLLPLSQEQFSVPENLYLVGTMNTADRSIRMLDAAVRRRFAFLEQLPDSGPLQGCHVEQLHLADLLDGLNQRVRTHLDREKQIGQAFLLPNGAPVDSVSGLAAIVRDEILPLLQEYAFDDYSLLASFLGEALVDLEAHTMKELSDEGLVKALYTEFQVKDGAAE